MEAAEDLVDALALRFLELPAGEFLGRGVQVFDDHVPVGRDHAVADRLQRDLRAFLFLEQRVFVELALGDVELDAHQPAQSTGAVDARLGPAHDPAPVALDVPHAVHAFEHRRLAGDMVTDHRLDAGEVVRVHEASPVWRHLRVVLVIAQHLPPARRVVDGVVLDVEIPHAVIGGRQRQRIALLELGQVTLHAQALEAGGEARADQLEHQVQVGVPAVLARLRREQRDEAIDAIVQRHPAHEGGAHVELDQARRIGRVLATRVKGVADLGEPQVLELAGQHRQAVGGIAFQDLRIERCHQTSGCGDPLDDLALAVEQRDADGVDAGCFTQRVEVALDAIVARFAGEAYEVDGDLGDEHVETDGGALAVAEDELCGQEICSFLFLGFDRRGLRRHRAVRSPWRKRGRLVEWRRLDLRLREPDSDTKSSELKLRR